jgi:hypothetical protein
MKTYEKLFRQACRPFVESFHAQDVAGESIVENLLCANCGCWKKQRPIRHRLCRVFRAGLDIDSFHCRSAEKGCGFQHVHGN